MTYKEIQEKDLPTPLVNTLNELVETLLAEPWENLKQSGFNPSITNEHCLNRVSKEALDEIKLLCDDQEGYIDPTDKRKYRYRARNSGDKNHLGFYRWLKDRGLINSGALLEHFQKFVGIAPKLSGYYWYPENGYMGWHTNENQMGSRIYCSYAAEAHKSFFRYQIPRTEKIITSWDKKGWTVRSFDVGNTSETRLWHCVYSNTNRLSFGFKPAERNEKFRINTLGGHHVIKGKWSLEGLPPIEPPNYYMIKNARLKPLLENTELVEVDFSEICHRGMDMRNKKELRRYEECDTSFPCILVEGMPNHQNRKYRMIDGKHRMRKMKDSGVKKAAFYVLSLIEVEPLIETNVLKQNSLPQVGARV